MSHECLTIIRRSVRECAEANFPDGPCILCLRTLQAALKAKEHMEALNIWENDPWLMEE